MPFKKETKPNQYICSSHRSISFRESMSTLSDSATNWPIQAERIDSFFLSRTIFSSSFLGSVSTAESHEPVAQTDLSHMTATDSTLNPIAEEHAVAIFTHASYKPKTNKLTSDAKRDTFLLSLLYTCYDNKPFFVVLFKRSFVIHLCCQIIYSVREINHFPKTLNI